MATVTPDFHVRRTTRGSTIAVGVFLAVVVVLALSPFWGSVSTTTSLIRLCTLVCLAQMWNLLAGYGGLVSIGQQAYIGIGAYTLVYLGNEKGIQVFVCVGLAAIVALIFAVPLAAAAFRLRGGYFAIGTWVLAEVCRLIAANTDVLGGGTGTSLTAVVGIDPSTRQTMTLWLAVAAGAGSTLLVWSILRSRAGAALTALRDSPEAAASLGVAVTRTKVLVYFVAAAGTAVAGAIIYLNLLRVEPSAAFSVNWTVYMIFIVVIGGIGTIEGPLLGAILFFVLQEQLADIGSWYLVILGLVALAVTMRLPTGIWGWASERFSLSLFPTGRRLELGVSPRATQPPRVRR